MAAYYKGDLNDNDIYYLELARITEEDLQTLDTDLRKAYVVKQAMDMPSSGQTKIIKSDVTVEEAAFLIEHMEDYQGFNVDFDWDSEYPFGTMLKSVLGHRDDLQAGAAVGGSGLLSGAGLFPQ